jgi:hypothetical protein
MSGIDISRFINDGVGSRALGSIRSIQVVDIVSGQSSYTINTIIPDNTILLTLGTRCGESICGTPTITSATTISADSSIYAGQILVLEFEPSAVKSKQTGTVSNIPDNGTPVDVTINSVNTSKCLVNCWYCRYYIHEDSNPDLYTSTVLYSFPDNTTIRFVADVSSLLNDDPDISYEILELV